MKISRQVFAKDFLCASKIILTVVFICAILFSNNSFARGSRGGCKSRTNSRHITNIYKTNIVSHKVNKNSIVVRDYVKKNNKQVKAHHRSRSDKTRLNNYSTKGNVNPYTGKIGTKPNNKSSK